MPAAQPRGNGVSRVLALGQFDYSRHTLTALADHGVDIRYGFVGKPVFLPEETDRLRCFPLSRANRVAEVAEAVAEFRPDAVFVGTASYDGSNQLARDLLDAGLRMPLIRFYKEFRIKPSPVERQVLRAADGVVAGGHREALYLRAVYGLPAERVHVFDPDLVSRRLLAVEPAPRLSASDGQPHVMLGGNLKSDDSEFDYRELLAGLADGGVHVHVFPLGFSRWLSPGRALDPDSEQVRAAYQHFWHHPRIHLEQPVFGAGQIRSWSRFDAGLTQRPPGVFWPELTPVQNMNLPSKYSYYLAAGLPPIVHREALPSLRELLAGQDVLIEYDDVAELAKRLHALPVLRAMGDRARAVSARHTADAGVPELLSFVAGVLTRSGSPAPATVSGSES